MAVRAFIIFKKAETMFERQLPARVHCFVSGSPEQQSTARLLHLENEGKGVFDLYFCTKNDVILPLSQSQNTPS